MKYKKTGKNVPTFAVEEPYIKIAFRPLKHINSFKEIVSLKYETFLSTVSGYFLPPVKNRIPFDLDRFRTLTVRGDQRSPKENEELAVLTSSYIQLYRWLDDVETCNGRGVFVNDEGRLMNATPSRDLFIFPKLNELPATTIDAMFDDSKLLLPVYGERVVLIQSLIDFLVRERAGEHLLDIHYLIRYSEEKDPFLLSQAVTYAKKISSSFMSCNPNVYCTAYMYMVAGNNWDNNDDQDRFFFIIDANHWGNDTDESSSLMEVFWKIMFIWLETFSNTQIATDSSRKDSLFSLRRYMEGGFSRIAYNHLTECLRHLIPHLYPLATFIQIHGAKHDRR